MEVKGVKRVSDGTFSVEITTSNENGVFIGSRHNYPSVIGNLIVVHGVSEADATVIDRGEASVLDSYIVPNELVPGAFDPAEGIQVTLGSTMDDHHSEDKDSGRFREFAPYQPVPAEA
jgi:hypothetical protein